MSFAKFTARFVFALVLAILVVNQAVAQSRPKVEKVDQKDKSIAKSGAKPAKPKAEIQARARNKVFNGSGLIEITIDQPKERLTQSELDAKTAKLMAEIQARAKAKDPQRQAAMAAAPRSHSPKPVVTKPRYMSQEEMMRRDRELNGGFSMMDAPMNSAQTSSAVRGLQREFARHGSLRYQGMDGYVHQFGKNGDQVIGPAVGPRVGPNGLVSPGPILYGR